MKVSLRLAVVGPDLVKGVHAATVTIVPYYLATTLALPELTWVLLGGWFALLADPGGPRRTRLIAGLAFLALGSAAMLLATLASATTPTAALALGGIVFVASLAPALGSRASGVGSMIALAAGVAASRPGSPAQAALFAAGATWATLTAMIAWSVRPHLPVRLAVGRVFERLAEYVEAIGAAEPAAWAELGRKHQRAVRGALEEARATALALRARRTGESPIGANLRVAIGAAETIFFRTIELAETVERGGAVPGGLAAALRAIAEDLHTARTGAPVTLAGDAPIVEATRGVAGVVSDLGHLRPVPTATETPARPSAFRLRDALSPRGPIAVHAVRVAILAAVTVALSRTVTPAHPTWATVTAIAVLQPSLGTTYVRAVERVIGTIFGAAIAVTMIAAVRSPVVRAALLFPLSTAALVVRPRSYRLFVLFITPLFVILTDVHGTEWHDAIDRILDISLGGALAVVASLIAPSRERPRLAEALDGVLVALGQYAALATRPEPREAVVAARRGLGLALEQAEASLERLLAEPLARPDGVERAMFLVTYARYLGANITALLEGGVAVPPDIAGYLEAVIGDVRVHLASGAQAPPRPTPQVETPALTSLVRRGELIARIAAREDLAGASGDRERSTTAPRPGGHEAGPGDAPLT